MSEPITVAELMSRLNECDPNAVVMIECADNYYSGPLTLDLVRVGEAFKIGPFTYEVKEDEYGRPVKRKCRYAGGWQIDQADTRGEVLHQHSCVIIETPP